MTGTRRDGGFTLIELLIVIIIIGILAAVAIPMFMGQRDKAKDATVKSGIHEIELGLGSYALDMGDVYPLATAVVADADGPGTIDPDPAQRTVGDWVDPWPRNPWTGADMQQQDAAVQGDFTYTPVGDPADTFVLVGHLSEGNTFVVP